MRLGNLRTALSFSVGLAALLSCEGAFAQAEPAQAAATPAAGSVEAIEQAARLGEIIVTARRRQENLQAVPIAVTVVSQQQIDNTGVSTINQLTQLAPSLQVLSPNGRNTAVTIRGLGASYGLANDGLEQGVGIYVDQVYNSRPGAATFDFMDIDRIEVLRGPQGTLFGKNTTAGALNITTRDATFTPEAQGEISVGDYNYTQAKATLSGPIVGDELAGRLSLVTTHRDGMLFNPIVNQKQNEQKSVSFRTQLFYKPTDKLSVRLYADYARQEPNCCTQIFLRYGPTLKPANQQYPALSAGRNYKPPSTNIYDRLADVDDKIGASQTLQGTSLIVDYDLGGAALTSITAYRQWTWEPENDRDYTALDVTRRSNNPSQQNQFSQELRLASTGSHTIDWQGGLYYYTQNITTHGVTEYGDDASYWLLPATNSPASLLSGYTVFNDSSIDTKSYAAFGQATWNVSPKFRVTPGLRYTYEKKDGYYAATTTGGSNTTDATLLTRRLGVARPQAYAAKDSDGSVSGQLALSYDLNDDLHPYATFSRGFKSGGINMAGIPTTASGAPALVSAVVRPEKVTTYEAGLKTQFFDRLLTANLAAFYTDVGDFQANVVDSGPGALRGYLANAEKVKVKGAELDLSVRPIGGVSAYGNLAWTDGGYVSFKNGPCPLEQIGTSTAACDLSGRELPGVSRWAISGGAEYRHDAKFGGIEGDAYLGVDANFRSSYYADAATSNYSRIKGYEIFNLRLGFRTQKAWEAFVWARNVFDKNYVQNITIVSGNSGLVVGTPSDPRTVGVTLRARY